MIVDALKKTHSAAQVHIVTRDIKLIPLHNQNSEHEHLNVDPHFWLSPQRTIEILPSLSQDLQKIYPDKKMEILKKTQKYEVQLKDIQSYYQVQFSKIPENQRKIIVSHQSFQYFSEEFKVKVYAVLDIFEENEPTIQTISKLNQLIQKDHIKSLFLEKNSPSSTLESLSKENHISIGETLYTDSLSTDDKADTYLKLLRYDYNLILNSLKSINP